jgi:hypothetical protein
MSTNRDCQFKEVEIDQWYYWLETALEDDYDKYGPFHSFTQAQKHLRDNHANPGGFSWEVHPDHVHRFGRGECVGCGEKVPLECGCPDQGGWHEFGCDQHVFNVRLRVSTATMNQTVESGEVSEKLAAFIVEAFRAEFARESKFASK